MDPEQHLRELLGRLANRPLSGSLEERVLSRTTRRASARGSRLLALGGALATAVVVGGVLYGVTALGRHHAPRSGQPQGAGIHSPRPTAQRPTPTPSPTPLGPPSPSPHRPHAVLPSPSPTGAVTAVPPAVTPAAPVPSVTPRALAACSGRELTIAERPGPRTASAADAVYILTNVGGSACTLRGVPAVRQVVAGGGASPLVPVRARSGPHPLVVLRPGELASFVLRDRGCHERTVTLGDATLEVEVTLPGAAGGSPLLVRGGLVCGPTAVEVSAIRAGVARPVLGPQRSATPRATPIVTAPATPRASATPTGRSTPTARPTPTRRARPTASPTEGRTPRPTPRPTQRPTPRPTPFPTPTAAPTPTPAPVPLCSASELHFAVVSGPVTGQSTSVSLGLTDDTAAPCLLAGLPAVSLTLADGTAVPLTLSSVSYNPNVELVLAPLGQIGPQDSGAVVVLDLRWPSSSLGCPDATGVAIAPKYLGAALTVHDVPVPVCTGAANVTAQLQAFGS
ncbi:MAG TPA: DUF4232 domain-containing protein [Candidatus Micrarchaeia archaeon]|nr:DUF4232 domain-containing protein [Candidatus Micrarchaeia archaeon]